MFWTRWEGMERGLFFSINSLGGLSCFPPDNLSSPACGLQTVPGPQGLGRKVGQVNSTCCSSVPHLMPMICLLWREVKQLDAKIGRWELRSWIQILQTGYSVKIWEFTEGFRLFYIYNLSKEQRKLWEYHFRVSSRFFQSTDMPAFSYLFG